jgi:small-conductance mechanosensitive channel
MCARRIVLLALCWFLAARSVGAAEEPVQGPPPPAVQELIKLLQDPSVAAWLHAAEDAGAPATATAPAEPAATEGQLIESDISQRVGHVRAHLHAMVEAAPRFGIEAGQAIAELRRERAEHPPGSTLALFALFLGAGALAEFLFRRALRPEGPSRVGSDTAERVGAVGVKLMMSLIALAIFALASVGPFLLIEWPPLLKDLALHLLMAIILTRLALLLLRAVFASARQNAREENDADTGAAAAAAAKFWYRYTAAFFCYFICGSVIVRMLPSLGFSADVRQLAGYVLAAGLLLIALVAIWRRPHRRSEAAEPRWRRPAVGVLLSLYVLALWLLWVAGLRGLLWIGLLAFILPRAIAFSHATVARLLTPKDASGPTTVRRALLEVSVGRGVRALLVVAAALWLAHAADVDVAGLTSDETPLSRFLEGLLTSIVIFLVADFSWQLIKCGLNAKVAATSFAESGTTAAIREARLRTLIPIFRNVIFVVIVAFAVLMALAALGVQIGPLIAGAGVLGVAIGFGAQNLVKDIISGMFYLVDDAFRVGEYIQSGSYKGTVEGFSLRSIRLRHQNGPVFVIPFSELGAVENMSRDWVIDKFSVGITYDSDFEKARKLIKQIGQDLQKDLVYAKNIIEPLKMQGVDQLGDFAVVLRCKMKTRPGEQFAIRRKALAMIKRTFDENGIKFAFPTVQVAGGGEASQSPAVAHEALELLRPAAAS